MRAADAGRGGDRRLSSRVSFDSAVLDLRLRNDADIEVMRVFLAVCARVREAMPSGGS